MEPNSTQAVTPTSTTVAPSVKRLRRGDVREDGKLFWCYGPSYANGEWWMTSEQFAAEKATERTKNAERKVNLSAKKATLTTKLRRGDVRGDGTVFWKYGPSYEDGEWWMTSEQFAAEKSRQAKKRTELSAKKAALPTKLRRGETREDGMVFWGYNPNYEDGEWWVTPEAFTANKAKNAERKVNLSTKKAALPTKLRCGDVREDGMVFWGYHPDCTDGEHWLTPKEFAAKKAKANARKRERRATDPLYALKGRLRNRISASLKSKGFRKNTKTAIMLGCTYEEFKAHIERLFLPGMSWASFSDCHVDHIVPLDAADTEADVYALNHYTNLRPMWGPDNIAKSDTLPEEHELPDNLHPKVKEIWLTAKSAST